MLLTKLHIPPVGINIVHRTELYDKLNMGLSRKLTLVSAPAGYGKTTLISDWIKQQNITTVWYSIDNADNDPLDFLSYLISGIQGIYKEFGQSSLKLLNLPNKPSSESILGILINEILKINHNFLLVLDDFHLIESNDVLKIVIYLLDHIPTNIHIVILTRSDPSIAISRLRSQHQLVELRSSDLSFSVNDISILFNKKLKLGVSIEDVYSLESKTEGWIAGLQLTALSIYGREDISKFIKDLKGGNRYIMDYLIEQVLKVQTDDIKEFLLLTSVLEQMSAPLCNAVLNRNDSQIILEHLEKNNMFVIPLDDERNWYRYHHLFADLLKQRFQQKNKTDINNLHNKASEWFKNNAMPLLAIRHTIETKDFDKSVALLGEIIETMWTNGQHAAIIQYGDLIPDKLIKKNADFCLYYAWILIITGQIKKAAPFLESAEFITKKLIKDESSSKELIQNLRKLLGKISVAFAYLYSIIANSEKSLNYSKTAMENLSEDDPLWYSWGWYSIGIAETVSENFIKSIEAYEKALEYGKKTGNIYLISTIAINLAYLESRMGLYSSSHKKCTDLITFMKDSGYSQIAKAESSFAGLYSCLAGIESMRTDFDDALKNIKIAYSLSKNDSNSSFKVVVLLVYSLTLYGLGDTTGVLKKLNEIDDIINQNSIAPGAMAIYVAMKGFMLIEQNEFEKANTFFKENGLEYDKKMSYSEEHGYSAFALFLIVEKKYEEAEFLLLKLIKMAEIANRKERIIENKIVYAYLNKSIGDKAKAIKNLVEALEYAAEENIIMDFIFYNDRINDLLKEVFKIQATTVTNIPNQLIEKLKRAIERRGQNKKTQIEFNLSSRELDTLKLIADDLSNQEIADKLFISLNTVKTHVKNILLKLEVDSRIHAVTKAKGLGII